MPTQPKRRNTPQRQIILEKLCGTQSHPTASELYDIVKIQLPRISLGTVYRNLEVLANNGQIAKLDLAGGEARFDGTVSPHCHIRCTDCGIVRDLPAMNPREPDLTIGQTNGFLVSGFRMEYTGICANCQ
ncbi:MAG: transcriptional repressor [bacterium]|nr:transcriptional repressor [bacterium]